MNHNPSVFTINDNYYTPREAWEDISHLIPANKIVYEGFVGSSSSGLYLDDILPNQVIYDKEVDFFNNNFNYDVLVSNPPFSLAKEILKHLKQLNKPFILLLPVSRICTQYMRRLFKDELQIIIPKKRINFIADDQRKKYCNFDCFWYCYGIDMPSDIVWL